MFLLVWWSAIRCALFICNYSGLFATAGGSPLWCGATAPLLGVQARLFATAGREPLWCGAGNAACGRIARTTPQVCEAP